MSVIRKILVGVKSPMLGASSGVNKAAQLAQSLGAKLELFHALDQALPLDPLLPDGLSMSAAKRELRAAALSQLDKSAERLRARGLEVDCAAEWDYPAWEALIRHARKSNADLIVAERHAGTHAGAWLMHYTDWELLRQSPAPVLLVGSLGRYSRPKVLAAVDPLHTHDKTAELDHRIAGMGRQLAKALGGSLELFHAYEPAMPVVGTASGAIVVVPGRDDSDARARERLTELGKSHDVPAGACLLAVGPPALAIPAMAKKRRSQIVAMGAVSRSGLKRVFIGNTAEQVLAKLDTDLLIVKPKAFKDKLPRAGRGVRIMLPAPM